MRLLRRPDVLLQAFKTFMWKNPKAEKYTTSKGTEKYRWGFCHGIDPSDRKKRAKYGDKLPPVHPIFQHVIDRVGEGKPAFSTAVIDEVHRCSNPRTWTGHIIGKLCKEAIFTIGLTGTPVRAKPKQVAWIVKAINVQPDFLQDPKRYTVYGGGENCVRRSTVNALHDKAVDRVDDTVVDLQPLAHLTLEYDPFVGRNRDGSHDEAQIERHNSWVERAKRLALEATESGTYKKAFDDIFWQACTTMGQFTFDPTLGLHGAEAFEKEPGVYYKLAARQPSQTVRLIWRMARDRQSKGHTRIVVYSESTVMLTIARNYLAKAGHCGKLWLYTGKLNVHQRDTVLKNFLHADNPKGVLLISSAGAIGTNLCPGCDTMFVVGDVPWNNADLAQAHGRVHRITQDKPVEIVQFCPRRSVTAAKLAQHVDKRDRLEPALRDQDFTNFNLTANEEEEKATWRERAKTSLDNSALDALGNYEPTAETVKLEEEWKKACGDATASGADLPPKPAACILPTAELADRIQLPPVSWPIEGFVEPESEDEDADHKRRARAPAHGLEPELDSDEEDAVLEEMLAGSKFAPKRPGGGAGPAAAAAKVQRLGRIEDEEGQEEEEGEDWLVDDGEAGSEESEDDQFEPSDDDESEDEDKSDA